MTDTNPTNIIQFPVAKQEFPEVEEFLGYTITRGNNYSESNLPTLKITKVSSRTNRVKVICSYYYKTVAERELSVNKHKNKFQSIKDDKDATKKKRKEFKHEYVVGDVFVSSWGYDQTNVNFFQVVKNTDKSVWVREIGSNYKSTGDMCGMSSPRKDFFLNEDIKRCLVNVHGRIKIGYHNARKCSETESFYTSSYA